MSHHSTHAAQGTRSQCAPAPASDLTRNGGRVSHTNAISPRKIQPKAWSSSLKARDIPQEDLATALHVPNTMEERVREYVEHHR